MDKTNPDYYTEGGIDTYDFIRAKDLNYPEGQVVKYIVRNRKKGGVLDLKKAKWYLDKLIKELELRPMEYID